MKLIVWPTTKNNYTSFDRPLRQKNADVPCKMPAKNIYLPFAVSFVFTRRILFSDRGDITFNTFFSRFLAFQAEFGTQQNVTQTPTQTNILLSRNIVVRCGVFVWCEHIFRIRAHNKILTVESKSSRSVFFSAAIFHKLSNFFCLPLCAVRVIYSQPIISRKVCRRCLGTRVLQFIQINSC